MDGGNGRADWLTTSDHGNADRAGIDSGWYWFIEMPEFVTLIEVGLQLINRPRPLSVMRL
jgi:hypothetical protein